MILSCYPTLCIELPEKELSDVRSSEGILKIPRLSTPQDIQLLDCELAVLDVPTEMTSALLLLKLLSSVCFTASASLILFSRSVASRTSSALLAATFSIYDFASSRSPPPWSR